MKHLAATLGLVLSFAASAQVGAQQQPTVVTCMAIECLWSAPGFTLGSYNPVSYTGRCANLSGIAPSEEGIFEVTLTIRCLYAPTQTSTVVHWLTVAASSSVFFDGFETPSSRWSATEPNAP